MGSKIDLTKKQVESIAAMAGHGLNVTTIAHALGMSKKTLERRIKDSPPELGAADALARGRAIAKQIVSQTAFNMASGGRDASMTRYWLNCRAGWAEKQKVEHTGKDGEPIKQEMKIIVEDYCDDESK